MCSEMTLSGCACGEQLKKEFGHLQREWLWLFLYGVVLTVCGACAIIFPPLTLLLSLSAVVVLGIVLMIAGVITIITSLWAGKWSGTMVQLLVGVLYLVIGFMISDKPLASAETMTLFIAAFCMVAGIFRTVSALSLRYPFWGWSLLNGMITMLLGLIIYRQFPYSAAWVLGLLVGLELFFHGWTWVMISLALKKLPTPAA
jgi:uncharacterized membrane protein HdeD (DUF308 family)